VRVAWRLPVRIHVKDGGTVQDTTMFNLSAGGICVMPPQALECGTQVEVEFHLPHGVQSSAFYLGGTVVRDVSMCGGIQLSGIAFDDTSERERQLLRRLVLQRALAQIQSIAEYQAFSNLSDLDLIELGSVSHEMELDAGDHAAHFGDEATSVFLVKKGSVELRAPAEEQRAGAPLEVARAGQVFGEVSALLGMPHNLDIVALEATELFVVPRTALAFLRDHNPHLALQLYEIFTAFMGRRLRRMTGRLISPLSY